jgi:hypothetical protein
MYSKVIINLKNLPKIDKNKIISKEMYDLFTIQKYNCDKVIHKKYEFKNKIKYRSSPW